MVAFGELGWANEFGPLLDELRKAIDSSWSSTRGA